MTRTGPIVLFSLLALDVVVLSTSLRFAEVVCCTTFCEIAWQSARDAMTAKRCDMASDESSIGDDVAVWDEFRNGYNGISSLQDGTHDASSDPYR